MCRIRRWASARAVVRRTVWAIIAFRVLFGYVSCVSLKVWKVKGGAPLCLLRARSSILFGIFSIASTLMSICQYHATLSLARGVFNLALPSCSKRKQKGKLFFPAVDSTSFHCCYCCQGVPVRAWLHVCACAFVFACTWLLVRGR